jgi:cell division protease FtsH
MNKTLGQVAYESEVSKTSPASELFFKTRTYSEETAREIDCAVKKLVSTAFERAKTILELNKNVLVEAAALLLEKETLTREECEPLFKRIPLSVPKESHSRAPSLLKEKGG